MIRLRINRDTDDSRRCWLVGNPAVPDREWTMASGISRQPVRQQQVDSGAGWNEKQRADKGNQHIEFTATTTRNFGSAKAAWNWKNLLCGVKALQPFPWQGDVIERHENTDGTFDEIKWPNALVAVNPVTGHGASQALNFAFKAGHCEPFRTGQRCVMTVPVMSNARLKIYATNAGGTFTDGDESAGMAWALGTDELQVGDRFVVYWKPDSLSQTTKEFRIGVTPGGGYTVIDHPLIDHLADLVTALDAEADLSASLVTPVTGRPYVLVTFVGTIGVDGVGGTVVGLYAQDGPTSPTLVYSAGNEGAITPHVIVIGSAATITDEPV